jgi:hypothetical protein
VVYFVTMRVLAIFDSARAMALAIVAAVALQACGEEFGSDSHDDGGATDAGSGGMRAGGSGGMTSGGSSGVAGSATGGSGGAQPTGGSGGAQPTGGSGGAQPTGGTGGAQTTGGSGGASASGGSGGNPCGQDCGALHIADLADIDVTNLPGFNLGARCKALAVCAVSHNCLYFSERLGHRQSWGPDGGDAYEDGLNLAEAAPIKIRIQTGANSLCGDPPLAITAGQSILITYEGGQSRTIYFPTVVAKEITLYVREDGATYYDAALTQLAQPSP